MYINGIEYAGEVFDDGLVYDEKGNVLHIERGYEVRINTFLYSTNARGYTEVRYKIFDENGEEVFNDSYIFKNTN